MRGLFLAASIISAGMVACTADAGRKETLDDARYLIAAVKENYPYLQVHERKSSFDWERRANEEIAKWKKGKISYDLDLFERMLGGLNGHVAVLTADKFAGYYAIFSTAAKGSPEYKTWMGVLDRPEVKAAYKYEGKAPGGRIGEGEGREVPRLAIAHMGNLLYFPIPSFGYDYVDAQGREILAALREGSGRGRAIVFDIRGNGGGSDSYWSDNLVAPLADKKLEARYAILFMGGKESLPFIKAKGMDIKPIAGLGRRLAHPEDLKLYQFYAEESIRVEPARKPIEHGKIYVIMDKSNFSSSETFVSFCKATGFATLVGQGSSGDGIGFDPIFVELPNSHYIVTMPVNAALNADGTLNYECGTEPDVALDPWRNPILYIMGLAE